MKGKHKHKWDYLREILFEKIVYDDVNHRAWYTDDSKSQGLLFAAKQAQINMDKPVGGWLQSMGWGPFGRCSSWSVAAFSLVRQEVHVLCHFWRPK